MSRIVLQRARMTCLTLASLLTAGLAHAAEPLDTRKLPRIDGGSDAFTPSAGLTAFDLPSPAVQTRATATLELLAKDGWRPFTHPNVRTTTGENVVLRSLKKGPHGLNVVIAFANRDAVATRITYEARPLPHDLPFPDGAADVKFDPDKPQLFAVVPAAFETVAPAMRQAMEAAGWSPSGPAAASGSQVYRKDDGTLVRLAVARRVDGTAHVTILRVEERELKPADEPRAARAPAKSPMAEMQDLMNEAKKMMADAQKETERVQPSRGAPKATPAPVVDEAPLTPRVPALSAPIPVPSTADVIVYDKAGGRLEFKSASSLRALSAFYRSELARLGWREERTVIDNERMVSLRFNKGRDQSLSFTLMAGREQSTVRADGSGLVLASATASNAPATAAAPASAPSSDTPQVGLDGLTAADQRGLPVPSPHRSAGSERTPYRQDVTAEVPASVSDVLAFYRRELSQRGWTETPGATADAAAARASFTTPDGPAELVLSRPAGADTTSSRLTLLREAKARADGILPAPGRAMLVFGNMEDTPATATVAGRTIRIGGGVGAQEPNGPKIDLAPGRHFVTIQIGKQKPRTEAVVLEPGRAWGMIMGPRGALTLPIY